MFSKFSGTTLLLAWLICVIIPVINGLNGSCTCKAMASLADQQRCLNNLVRLTQIGLNMAACASDVTINVQQQKCINNEVVRQMESLKMKSCIDNNVKYQDCINDAICAQFRFAEEGFKYIGKATMDSQFQPLEAYVKYNNKTNKLWDSKQNIDLPAFTFALRVVPSTADLFRSWRSNALATAPTPQVTSGIRVNPLFEDKHTQGDSKTQGHHRKLSYIFGTDDRVLVNPTTSYPWSAAVLIEFNIGSSGKGCSGTMVYGDAVLTAGHCVNAGSGGAWASNVRVSPGANSAARPYGTADVDYMTTYVGWASNGNFKYDMAVIKLTSNIGSTTGWLGMMSSNSFNSNLNAIGYPGDKAWPTEYYYYCPGVSDSDSGDSVTKNTCDIWPGQSGSGNYYKPSPTARYIRAITSYQTCTCLNSACSSCGSPYANYFQQLTSTRFSDAKAWARIP